MTMFEQAKPIVSANDNPLDDMNPQPGVTILLASYGRLEFLRQAVDSALRQNYTNFRVLIVDDGSDDGVVEWLRQLEAREPRVSVVYQDHQGVAAARATGVEMATTELICILDSDDLLAANALEILTGALRRQAGSRIAFCNIRELRANGAEKMQRYRQYATPAAMTRATLLKPRLPFKHSGTMMHRQTALDLGSYDVALPCKVDIDLFLKFLAAGFLPLHVDQALVDFRMHKNSVSINRMTGIRVWLYLIDRYGPGNPLSRLVVKSIRTGAELLKRVYMELNEVRATGQSTRTLRTRPYSELSETRSPQRD